MSWKVALVLMIGIGFHECGHLWASKRVGLRTRGFYLMPFMGGVALSQGTIKTFRQQAFIVIMGPVAGCLLAYITYGAYALTGAAILEYAVVWMAFVNLFNLLPLSFMDGGQLLESVVYSVNETFGLIVMAVSTAVAIPVLWFFNPLLSGMVAIFGSMGLYRDYQKWKVRRILRTVGAVGGPRLPKKMDAPEIMVTFASIVATAGALGLLLLLTHHLDVLQLFTN